MAEFSATPLAFVYVLSTLILLLLAVFVVFHTRTSWSDPITRTLVYVLLASMLWAGPYGLQLMAVDLPWKLWWFNVTQLGPSLLVPALLLHVSTLVGHYEWWTRPRRGLLAVEPVITGALVLTDGYHDLLRSGVELVAVGSTVVLHRGIGPWWFVRTTYLYLLIAVIGLLLLRGYRNADGDLRRQLLAGGFAIAFPLVLNVLFDLQFLLERVALEPVAAVEFTGAAFGFSGIVLTYSVLRYRYLDLAPVGRRIAIDTLPDPYVVTDGEFRILDYNPSFESLVDEPSDLIGVDIAAVLPEIEPLFEHTGPVVREDLALERANARWFDVSLVPLASAATGRSTFPLLERGLHTRQRRSSATTGETSSDATPHGPEVHDVRHERNGQAECKGYVLVFRDSTDRKARERLLVRQNEQLELLNRIVSHDIHNEMDLTMGLIRRVRSQRVAEADDSADDSIELPDDVLEYLEQVTDSSNRVVDLTETARDLVEALAEFDSELEPVPLKPVIEAEVLAAMSHEAAIVEVRRDIPDVSVVANELLSSVFRNLLTNAIVHNNEPHPKIVVDVSTSNGRVAIDIADNGPGISTEQRRVLRDDALSLDVAARWGTGLYLVHTLVEQYGGTLSVADNELGGTTITVGLQATEHGRTA